MSLQMHKNPLVGKWVEVSEHAKERMKERGVPRLNKKDPSLRKAYKRELRLIAKQSLPNSVEEIRERTTKVYKKSGFKSSSRNKLEYYVDDRLNVYAFAKSWGGRKHVLVTAFKLKQ